jgi:hypothetical protein
LSQVPDEVRRSIEALLAREPEASWPTLAQPIWTHFDEHLHQAGSKIESPEEFEAWIRHEFPWFCSIDHRPGQRSLQLEGMDCRIYGVLLSIMTPKSVPGPATLRGYRREGPGFALLTQMDLEPSEGVPLVRVDWPISSNDFFVDSRATGEDGSEVGGVRQFRWNGLGFETLWFSHSYGAVKSIDLHEEVLSVAYTLSTTDRTPALTCTDRFRVWPDAISFLTSDHPKIAILEAMSRIKGVQWGKTHEEEFLEQRFSSAYWRYSARFDPESSVALVSSEEEGATSQAEVRRQEEAWFFVRVLE